MIAVITITVAFIVFAAWGYGCAEDARKLWAIGNVKYAVACGIVASAPIALVVWVTINMVVYA